MDSESELKDSSDDDDPSDDMIFLSSDEDILDQFLSFQRIEKEKMKFTEEQKLNITYSLKQQLLLNLWGYDSVAASRQSLEDLIKLFEPKFSIKNFLKQSVAAYEKQAKRVAKPRKTK